MHGQLDVGIGLRLSDAERYRQLINAMPYFTILVDSQHRILLANTKLLSEFKLESEQILHKKCPSIIHGCDSFEHCPLEKAISLVTTTETEYFDSSTNRWFSATVHPTEISTLDGDRVFLHTIHDITHRKQAEQERLAALARYAQLTVDVIGVMTTLIDTRDPYTSGHQARVSNLASHIAAEMGASYSTIEAVRVGGLLHDIGKMAIPTEILSKPGKLTRQEFDLLRIHPEAGHNVLKHINFDWPVAEIALQHHERIDGSGYPRGLSGDDILLEAKILSVADVVEAMISRRPYREALGVNAAMAEVVANTGKLYDSYIVHCLERLVDRHGDDLLNIA